MGVREKKVGRSSKRSGRKKRKVLLIKEEKDEDGDEDWYENERGCG